MVDIIFDIETAPLEFGKNVKIDEETGQEKDFGALSPITGRVTAIGIKYDDKIEIFSHKDEKELLNNFWRAIDRIASLNKDFYRLVGFSIKGFDFHFLIVRSLANNVKIASKFNLKQAIDLRDHLCCFNTYMKKGTLDDYGKMIGVGGKYKELDGYEACLLWKEGKQDELEKYLRQDINITYELFKKCKELGILSDYA